MFVKYLRRPSSTACELIYLTVVILPDDDFLSCIMLFLAYDNLARVGHKQTISYFILNPREGLRQSCSLCVELRSNRAIF